jgi:hypothetical protein
MRYSFPFSLMRLRKSITDAEVKDLMGSSAIVQKKYDGHLVQMSVQNGRVQIFSRRGKDLTSRLKPLIPGILRQVKSDGVYLGELVAGKKNHTLGAVQSIASSAPARAAAIAKSEGARIVLFDKIFDARQSIEDQPYRQRLAELRKSVTGRGPLSKIKNYKWSERIKASKESVKEGGEGIVIKDPDAPYRASELGGTEKRGGQWKRKAPGIKDQSDDFVLYDYDWGKEKAIFRAGQYGQGALVHVGKISGLDKATEKQVVKRIDKGEHVVVEANYQQKTPSGKYRHLSWSRLRDDKPERSVTMPKRNPESESDIVNSIIRDAQLLDEDRRFYAEDLQDAKSDAKSVAEIADLEDPLDSLAQKMAGLTQAQIDRKYSLEEWESLFGPLVEYRYGTSGAGELVVDDDPLSSYQRIEAGPGGSEYILQLDAANGISLRDLVNFHIKGETFRNDIFNRASRVRRGQDAQFVSTKADSVGSVEVFDYFMEYVEAKNYGDVSSFWENEIRNVDAVLIVSPYYMEEFEQIPQAQSQGITNLYTYAEQVIEDQVEQEEGDERVTSELVSEDIAAFLDATQVDFVELKPEEVERQYKAQFGFNESRRLARFRSSSTYGANFVRLKFMRQRYGNQSVPPVVIDIKPAVSAFFVAAKPAYIDGVFFEYRFKQIPFDYDGETAYTVEEAKDIIFEQLVEEEEDELGIRQWVVSLDPAYLEPGDDGIRVFDTEDDAKNFLFVARGVPQATMTSAEKIYISQPMFKFSTDSWAISIANQTTEDGVPFMDDKWFENAVLLGEGRSQSESERLRKISINQGRMERGLPPIKEFEDLGTAIKVVKDMMKEGESPVAKGLVRSKDGDPVVRTKYLGDSVFGAAIDPMSYQIKKAARRIGKPVRVVFPDTVLENINDGAPNSAKWQEMVPFARPAERSRDKFRGGGYTDLTSTRYNNQSEEWEYKTSSDEFVPLSYALSQGIVELAGKSKSGGIKTGIEYLNAFSDVDSPDDVASWIVAQGANRILVCGLNSSPRRRPALDGQAQQLRNPVGQWLQEVIDMTAIIPAMELRGENREMALALKPELSPQFTDLFPEDLEAGPGFVYAKDASGSILTDDQGNRVVVPNTVETEAYKTALALAMAVPSEDGDGVAENPFYIGQICQGAETSLTQRLYAIQYEDVTYYITVQSFGSPETLKYAIYTESAVTLLEKQCDRRVFDKYLKEQAVWEMTKFGVSSDVISLMSRKGSYEGTNEEVKNYGEQVGQWATWYSSHRLLPFMLNWKAYRNEETADACKREYSDRYLIGSTDKNVLAPAYMSGPVKSVAASESVNPYYSKRIEQSGEEGSNVGSPTFMQQLNIARFADIFDSFNLKESKSAQPMLLPSGSEDVKSKVAQRMMATYLTDQAVSRSYFATLEEVRSRGLDDEFSGAGSFEARLPNLYKSINDYFNGPLSPYSFVYAYAGTGTRKEYDEDSRSYSTRTVEYQPTVTPFWAGLSVWSDDEGMRGAEVKEFEKVKALDSVQIVLDDNSTISDVIFSYNARNNFYDIAGACLLNGNGYHELLGAGSPYAANFEGINKPKSNVWEFEPEDMKSLASVSYKAASNFSESIRDSQGNVVLNSEGFPETRLVEVDPVNPQYVQVALQLRPEKTAKGYMRQLSRSGLNVPMGTMIFSRKERFRVQLIIAPNPTYEKGFRYQMKWMDENGREVSTSAVPVAPDDFEDVIASLEDRFGQVYRGVDPSKPDAGAVDRVRPNRMSNWQLNCRLTSQQLRRVNELIAPGVRPVATQSTMMRDAFRMLTGACIRKMGSTGLLVYVCPIPTEAMQATSRGQGEVVQVNHVPEINAFPEAISVDGMVGKPSGSEMWIYGARKIVGEIGSAPFIFLDPAQPDNRRDAITAIVDYVRSYPGQIPIYLTGPSGVRGLEKPCDAFIAELTSDLFLISDEKDQQAEPIQFDQSLFGNPSSARTTRETTVGDTPAFYYVVDRPEGEFNEGEDLLLSGSFGDGVSYESYCDEVVVGQVYRSFNPPASLVTDADLYAKRISEVILSDNEGPGVLEIIADDILGPKGEGNPKKKRSRKNPDRLEGAEAQLDVFGERIAEASAGEIDEELDYFRTLREKAESNDVPFIVCISGETTAETLQGDEGYVIGTPDLTRMHFDFEIVPYTKGQAYADKKSEYVTLKWSVPGIKLNEPMISKVVPAEGQRAVGRDGAAIVSAVRDIVTKNLEDIAIRKEVEDYRGGPSSVLRGSQVRLPDIMEQRFPTPDSRFEETRKFTEDTMNALINNARKASSLSVPGVLFSDVFSPTRATTSRFARKFAVKNQSESNDIAKKGWLKFFPEMPLPTGVELDVNFWSDLYEGMKPFRVRKDKKLGMPVDARTGAVYELMRDFGMDTEEGYIEYTQGTLWVCDAAEPITDEDGMQFAEYQFRHGTHVIGVTLEDLNEAPPLFSMKMDNLSDPESWGKSVRSKVESYGDQSEFDQVPLFVSDMFSNAYQIMWIYKRGKQLDKFMSYAYGPKGEDRVTVVWDPDFEVEDSPRSETLKRGVGGGEYSKGAFKVVYKDTEPLDTGAVRTIPVIEYAPTAASAEGIVNEVSGGTARRLPPEEYRVLISPIGDYEGGDELKDDIEIYLSDLLKDYAPIANNSAFITESAVGMSYPKLWVDAVKAQLAPEEYSMLYEGRTAREKWSQLLDTASLSVLNEVYLSAAASGAQREDWAQTLMDLSEGDVGAGGERDIILYQDDEPQGNPRRRAKKNPCIGLHFHSDDMDAVLRAIEDKNGG